MLRIFGLAILALAGSTSAVATLGAAAPPAYSRLQGVRVSRATDGSSVLLTEQWRKDIAFGLGGERAVVCFLRHFG